MMQATPVTCDFQVTTNPRLVGVVSFCIGAKFEENPEGVSGGGVIFLALI